MSRGIQGRAPAAERGGLDGAAIKYIAALTMLIDHIGAGILEAGIGADGRSLMFSVPNGELLDEILRIIGRIAFPIFLFFVVEGYLYTRNKLQYLAHMVFFGAAAHFPFKILFYPRSSAPHTDTMFTLALGLIAIWGIDELSEGLGAARNILPARRARGMEVREWQLCRSLPVIVKNGLLLIGGALLTAACGLAAERIGSDYTYGGVVAVVLLYVLYRWRTAAFLAAWAFLFWYNEYELMAVVGFALLLCYNGKRGKQNKYFFYLFYPLHLLLLVLLRQALPFVS